jgi:transitional endoplasmic reticulum ATPase
MLEEKAAILLNQARSLENSNPKQASVLYLDASEIFLYLSNTNNPYLSKKYVDQAQECYRKFEGLNRNTTEITPLRKEEKVSKLSFKDVGGLEGLKKEIRLRIVEPLKNPEVFKKFGKKLGGGILMYGPPGCGKSLIAEATANEADATFFHVKASDLKSKYVGETEQNIAKLFEDARAQAPSIIFFDEFEVLGGSRDKSDVYTRQAVSQLLTEMDGVGSKDDQILLLAATNEPWNIDIALRREGRFGRSLFIPPPDVESRAKILKILLKDKPTSFDVQVHELSAATPYFSGADLKGLVENATDIPLTEYLETRKVRDIARKDFKEVLIKQKPSSVPWFKMAEQELSKRNMLTDFVEVMDISAQLRENSMVIKVKS